MINLNDKIKDETFEVISNRNGGVVNYSPTASAALRCNTAAYHLGGNEQAKATLFYLIKYITKDSLTPTTSLALISYARNKVTENPSVANNTGTDLRTGQHLLTVMLNKCRSCKEIADTQAALNLLDMPAQFGTIKNTYLFINGACKKIKMRIKDAKNSRKKKNRKSSRKDNTLMHNLDRKNQIDNDVFNVNENFGKYESEYYSPGSCSFYEVKINNTIVSIPVSQDIHYSYRGLHLKDLSLFEYSSIIESVKIENKNNYNTESTLPKRKKIQHMPFKKCIHYMKVIVKKYDLNCLYRY